MTGLFFRHFWLLLYGDAAGHAGMDAAVEGKGTCLGKGVGKFAALVNRAAVKQLGIRSDSVLNSVIVDPGHCGSNRDLGGGRREGHILEGDSVL